jgi:hypothetical protein
MPEELTQPEPIGIEFYDAQSQRQMKYVYPDSKHHTAGWLLYRHPDGQWVTLRKATEIDVACITEAVVLGHHRPQGGE